MCSWWMTEPAKYVGNGHPINSTLLPPLTWLCLSGSIQLKEPSCFAKLLHRPSANSSFGQFCMTGSGRQTVKSYMVYKTMIVVLYAPNHRRRLIIYQSPALSPESSGSNCFTRLVGIQSLLLCKLTHWPNGGKLRGSTFKFQKDERHGFMPGPEIFGA